VKKKEKKRNDNYIQPVPLKIISNQMF